MIHELQLYVSLACCEIKNKKILRMNISFPYPLQQSSTSNNLQRFSNPVFSLEHGKISEQNSMRAFLNYKHFQKWQEIFEEKTNFYNKIITIIIIIIIVIMLLLLLSLCYHYNHYYYYYYCYYHYYFYYCYFHYYYWLSVLF